MTLNLVLVVLLCFLHTSLCLPSKQFELLESLEVVPPGWLMGKAAEPDLILKLRIALYQPRLYQFEQEVVEIATPGHPRYGSHFSREEVNEYLRPSSDIVGPVVEWLEGEGIKDNNINLSGNWITVEIPVKVAEKLLDTRFHYYKNRGHTIIRTLQYSVPTVLRHRIQMIQPTTRFGQTRHHISGILKAQKASPPVLPQGFNATFCNVTITPDCLKGLYQFDNFTAISNEKNKLAVSGYLEEYAQYDDLRDFNRLLAPTSTNTNFSVISINGGLNLQHNLTFDSGEANLDIQYASSLSSGSPLIFYSTGGRGTLVPDLDQPDPASGSNEPYLDQLHYLLSLPNEELPSVLTTSYGEDEQSVPASYANATCLLFAQLGARGVSVIFSSGDSGVGVACQTNDGKNTTRFNPIFPAACPFVTSVGGTAGIEPEVATWFSSGGFSDIFPRPAYQEAAVCRYLQKLGDKWQGLYNPAGRGFPDVAAQSIGFLVYDQGALALFQGTSCAAPTFAAVISNLNAIRLNAGLPVLGFLNPFIYSRGYQGMTDIVDGMSTGCNGYDQFSGLKTPYVPGASWNATEGWDPVTGWGTPVFPKLARMMTESV